MDIFRRIGERTRQLWSRSGFDEAGFTDIAVQVLEDMPPQVDALEVLQHYLRQESPPPQPRSDFGQPPVVVFKDRRFYIEVLYWMEGTTSLHQHAFSGAFHVLAGSSVQGLYSFEPQGRASARLLTGRLELQGVELLRKGSTRPIYPGRRLIHSLFHLEQPSATVVLRTLAEVDQKPQYDYRRPSIAYDGLQLYDDVERAVEVFHLLGRLDAAACEASLEQYLMEKDLTSVFFVLDAVAFSHPPVFKRVAADPELMRRARERHGACFDAVLEACHMQAWQSRVIDARVEMTEPDHRYLLALLLNVPRREDILRLVFEWSGRDPIQTIMQWVEAMAVRDEDGVIELPGFRMAPPSPGGRFHKPIYAVFRAMLEGSAVPDVEAAESIQEALWSSAFRPLFALSAAPEPAYAAASRQMRTESSGPMQ